MNYSFAPDTWYMMTYAVSEGEARIFVNGALENTVTWGTSKNGGDALLMGSDSALYLGQGAGPADSAHFKGSIDDFRVYNRALSNEDVGELYSSSVPEPGSVGLMAAGGLALLRRRRG